MTDPSAIQADSTTTAPPMTDEQMRLFDYQYAKEDIKHIISTWRGEIEDTDSRRNIRNIDLDIEQERNAGTIQQDETFIPVRVIDTNIRREQPPFISYLKQSRRLAIYKNMDNPDDSTEEIEEEFTRGMTYEAWENDFFKLIDGASTHGWDLVEAVFDETKPFHCAVEHIGHDKLYFHKDTINVQFAPKLAREYDVTNEQLKKFVKRFGFDALEVDRLIEARKERRDFSTTKILKVYFRFEGVVYVAWCDKESQCENWLKKPAKLYLGIRHKELQTVNVPQTIIDPLSGMPAMVQVPQQEEVWVDSDIEMYPIFLLSYTESEQSKIFDKKGRVFLDEFKQEAMTAITTAYVNGVVRASQVYASVEADDGVSGSIKQIQNLQGGTILSKPLKFFHQDYPDPSIINALQYLDTANSQETGQVAWAVNNRKDSRKTATEIQAATEQTGLLNSVQLTLFSTFLRSVYGFCWKIVQSQALQDKIKFLQIKEIPQVDPMTGQEILVPLPQPTNDYATIAQNYDIRAAGDVDVIQRAEKLQKMMQMWPMIAPTPLGLKFLEEILKVSFPEEAPRWILFMNQALAAQQQMMAAQPQQQQIPENAS